jgi:hypothetical protein
LGEEDSDMIAVVNWFRLREDRQTQPIDIVSFDFGYQDRECRV